MLIGNEVYLATVAKAKITVMGADGFFLQFETNKIYISTLKLFYKIHTNCEVEVQ